MFNIVHSALSDSPALYWMKTELENSENNLLRLDLFFVSSKRKRLSKSFMLIIYFHNIIRPPSLFKPRRLY